jgi:hypothetical protein
MAGVAQVVEEGIAEGGDDMTGDKIPHPFPAAPELEADRLFLVYRHFSGKERRP